MLPTAAVVAAAWLAFTRSPPVVPDAASAGVRTLPLAAPPWWQVTPAAAIRLIAAAGAVAITAVGAAPLAGDALRPHADTIITTALDGPPQAIDAPAGAFDLVDQAGRPVSLTSLRGSTVAITFLDPVCTSDCPIIGREFAQTDHLLGDAAHTTFVAVDINPRFTDPAYLRAFDAAEHLDTTPNWRYLTGSLPALQAVWKAYGAYVADTPGGGMVDHNDIAYVIGPDGRLRYELRTDPGSATAADQSSFAVTLAGAMRHVMAAPTPGPA
jgi:cytochrome oxidase Cu insertion factor (SCO1/SenC/PrrC family)